MLKANMEYGAVRTKSLAMYSKLLKDADFDKLCECVSIAEITTYLRGHKGYGEFVAKLPLRPTVLDYKKEMAELEQNDFEKLYGFLSIKDKKHFKLLLCRSDYENVLAVLRKLYSPGNESAFSGMSNFSKKHCNVDVDRLTEVTNYQELLTAVYGSIFEKPLMLLNLDTKTGLPDYTQASVAMENALYKAFFGYAKKSYQNISSSKLTELIGTEADILNIMHILRIRRYFPSSLENIEELLIPVKNRLDAHLIYSMRAARTEDETIEILRKSRCSVYLKDYNPANIDNLYEKAMGQFYNKLIRMPEPCLAVPIAYSELRRIESKKLIHIVEAVSYGMDPRKSL